MRILKGISSSGSDMTNKMLNVRQCSNKPGCETGVGCVTVTRRGCAWLQCGRGRVRRVDRRRRRRCKQQRWMRQASAWWRRQAAEKMWQWWAGWQTAEMRHTLSKEAWRRRHAIGGKSEAAVGQAVRHGVLALRHAVTWNTRHRRHRRRIQKVEADRCVRCRSAGDCLSSHLCSRVSRCLSISFCAAHVGVMKCRREIHVAASAHASVGVDAGRTRR